MVPRHAEARVRRALGRVAVVVLAGPRGAGKSTLARALARPAGAGRTLSLDDPLDLAEAARDPRGLAAGAGMLLVDEAERLPALLDAVADAVAADPTPGRFMLTASVVGPALRGVLVALGARAEVVPVWPLSAGEVDGRRERFVELLLADAVPAQAWAAVDAGSLAQRVARGGYPGLGAGAPRPGEPGLGDLLGAVLERDIRAVAQLDTLAELPRLLAAAIVASGATVSFADLARVVGLPQTTVKRHLGLLEAAFLLHRLAAWDGGPRAVRAPRLVPTDGGLACRLLGLDAGRLADDPTAVVPLLAVWVAGELARQVSWSGDDLRLHHFATYAGETADAVLETADGRLAAVAVCARERADLRDARGLAACARLGGHRFHRGVVLHLGDAVAELGERIVALPLTSLWTTPSATDEAPPAPPPPAAVPVAAHEPVRTSGCIWDPAAGW